MNMNIYITKDNTERLKNESSMSGLINRLLNNHYGKKPDASVEVGLKDSLRKDRIIKNPVEALSAVKAVGSKKVDIEQDFCPNGHPIPEGHSKCLGKGCKYSWLVYTSSYNELNG